MSVLLQETEGGVATLTMNRPDRRNALNAELLGALRSAMAAADADPDVAAIVLTGTDPAFCAGVDLKEIGQGMNMTGSSGSATPNGPWAPTAKPVVGAVNGPAVTGGLEIALQCDFLVASERATFGDTHARVGILPGWGLTVLLPQAIGVRRAKEMSLTGNFLSAQDAYHFGLANHVVAHGDLLAFARKIAGDIAGNDQRSVRAMLAEYKEVTSTTVADGLAIEAGIAATWNRDPAAVGDVERRRQAIIDRGRAQL